MGDSESTVRLTAADVQTIVRDSFATAVCKAHLEAGDLCGFVRMEGNDVRLIYPQGCEAEMARLFYRAADELVARIKPTDSAGKH